MSGPLPRRGSARAVLRYITLCESGRIGDDGPLVVDLASRASMLAAQPECEARLMKCEAIERHLAEEKALWRAARDLAERLTP